VVEWLSEQFFFCICYYSFILLIGKTFGFSSAIRTLGYITNVNCNTGTGDILQSRPTNFKISNREIHDIPQNAMTSYRWPQWMVTTTPKRQQFAPTKLDKPQRLLQHGKASLYYLNII